MEAPLEPPDSLKGIGTCRARGETRCRAQPGYAPPLRSVAPHRSARRLLRPLRTPTVHRRWPSRRTKTPRSYRVRCRAPPDQEIAVAEPQRPRPGSATPRSAASATPTCDDAAELGPRPSTSSRRRPRSVPSPASPGLCAPFRSDDRRRSANWAEQLPGWTMSPQCPRCLRAQRWWPVRRADDAASRPPQHGASSSRRAAASCNAGLRHRLAPVRRRTPSLSNRPPRHPPACARAASECRCPRYERYKRAITSDPPCSRPRSPSGSAVQTQHRALDDRAMRRAFEDRRSRLMTPRASIARLPKRSSTVIIAAKYAITCTISGS